MIARLRGLLQQSWFVGILVAVAIGISVRNIVLPLMGMRSVSGVQISGEPHAETGSLIARPEAAAVFGVAPGDYRRIRAEFFAQSAKAQRNPFKVVPPPKLVVLRGDVVQEDPQEPVLELTQALVDRIFSLRAVMASPGGRLALVNRQVVRVGDQLPVGYLEQSTDPLVREALDKGLIRYGMGFQVLEIQDQRVSISRDGLSFDLSLRED